MLPHTKARQQKRLSSSALWRDVIRRLYCANASRGSGIKQLPFPLGLMAAFGRPPLIVKQD
jgi:hypothetical protein